jgi:hypothetical protein
MFVFAATVGLLVVGAFYVGAVNTAESVRSAQQVLRWASSVSLAATALMLLAWRWVPPVQAAIFPYLGGTWTGEVRYDDNGVPTEKPVTMEVRHNLLGAKLLLDSEESTSVTLAVHADKDPDFDRFRLYYVYLNRRKEGVAGGGDAYRGLAIVRWIAGQPPTLAGDYFTDTHRRGTLHLVRETATAFWKVWR